MTLSGSYVVGRHDAGAARVERVEEVMEAMGVVERVARVAQLFVADGPNDDGRVVPVTEDKAGQLVVLPITVVFVPDEEPETVGGVEERRRGRVVRRPPRVATHLLELRDAVRLVCVCGCGCGCVGSGWG